MMRIENGNVGEEECRGESDIIHPPEDSFTSPTIKNISN
jgi:hypothetical protein